MEEQYLVQRIQCRNQAAMGELYDLYGTAVFSVLFRMTRNRGAAEDLTQEVFMRVWASIDKFDCTRAGLRTWILTIARNKAVDYWRSVDGQMDRLGCEWDEVAMPAADRTMEARLIRNNSLEKLQKGLLYLTTRQQEVIRLAYLEGKTQTEIAAEIQVPLGSVKTCVRTGILALRKLMNAQVGRGQSRSTPSLLTSVPR